MSVCLSVRPHGITRLPLDGFSWNLSMFRKSVNIQVSLILDKVNGTVHEDLYTFMIITSWILLRVRNVSDERCRETQNAHFMFNNVFPKIVPFWDNVEKCGWAWQATDCILQRMRLGIFYYGDLLRYNNLWTAPAVWSLITWNFTSWKNFSFFILCTSNWRNATRTSVSFYSIGVVNHAMTASSG